MITSLLAFAVAAGAAAWWLRSGDPNASLLVAVSSATYGILSGFSGDRLGLVMGSVNAALYLALWWNNPNGGGKARKTARQLGAKSHALLRSLLGQLSPAPLPGGAS